MKTVMLFFLYLSFVCSVAGQQIRGKVVDAATGEPLVGANVQVKAKGLGTATMQNGEFFAAFDKLSDTDSVYISFVGYKTQVELVSQFNGDRPKEIRLEVVPGLLQEMVVRATKEKFNVNTFMRHVLREYNRHDRKSPHIAKAYYREKARIDGKYVMFTEAIGYATFSDKKGNAAPLAQYQFFYDNTRKSERSEVWVDYRKYINAKGSHQSDVLLGGGNTLNSFGKIELYGPLSKSFQYELVRTYFESNRQIYVIKAQKDDSIAVFYVFGDNYHIIKMECEMNIYSNPFSQAIKGEVSVTFDYYNDVPFASSVISYYEHEGLEHWNELHVLLQKLNEYDINKDEFWALNSNSIHTKIEYDADAWRKEHIPEDPDYAKIESDLKTISGKSMEAQFRSFSGTLHYGEEPTPEEISLIKQLKALF